MTDEVGPPLPTPQHIARMCLTEMGDAHLGPTGQPCQVCGNDPEQRHRIWDTIAERWHATDTLDELAVDYAEPPDDWPYGADAICAVMVGQAAYLLAEARWHAESLTQGGYPGRITQAFPWEQPR